MDQLLPGIGIAAFTALILLEIVVIIGGVVLIAFFYKTLIDTLSYIRPSARKIEAGNVAFLFIPIFNFGYGFVFFPKLSESIQQEWKELGLTPKDDFGKSLGLVLQITFISLLIPVLNILAVIPFIVISILFWVKIDTYKKELERHNRNSNYNNSIPEINSEDNLPNE